MKKFLALLLILALMFNFSALAADDVQMLSDTTFLSAMGDYLSNNSIDRLKNNSDMRAGLVVCAIMDFLTNNILEEVPASANADMICVGIVDDIYSVIIPLENQILISYSRIGSDLHGYGFQNSTVNSKSTMASCMDTIGSAVYENYWFVSSDDISEFATGLSNAISN